MEKTLVLNKQQLQQKIDRLAWQIYEQNYKEKEIIIAGIANRGVLIAKKIAEKLAKISSIKIKLATIKRKMCDLKLFCSFVKLSQNSLFIS